MKKIRPIIIILALLLAVGILRAVWHPLRLDRFGSAELEWTDFVCVNGRTYCADKYVSEENQVEITTIDAANVGEELGTVLFTLEGKVGNPAYRLHDWDASYLPIGTPIYAIDGSVTTVAVLMDGVYYRYTI